jgi:hypothetical protein
LRERIDSLGRSLKYDWSSCADGMGGSAVVSSISSIGVGAALVAIVVQLKWDTSGGLPLSVAVVSVDPLFAIREGAVVDQLNLLCGWTSGTVNRSCGGKFSLAEGETDITGFRFTWFFAVTPRGNCATALTEIGDGAMLRAGDDVGEL